MVLELYYFVLLRNIRSEDLVGAWGKKKKKSFFEHLDHETIIKIGILVKTAQ